MTIESNEQIASAMATVEASLWRPFVEMTRQPEETQEKVLSEILGQNRESGFGADHGFSKLDSYEDFIEAVPVRDYEGLRKYIEGNALTTERPVFYVRTSGTTGQPKYLPILSATRERYRQSESLAVFCQYNTLPGIYEGKGLAIVSPEQETQHESGLPCGSMSGLIAASMPAFIQSKYVVPRELLGIDSYELKYFLAAAFALAEEDITFFASANPSTFLKLAEIIRDNYGALLSVVETGRTGVPDLKFPANPARAEALRQLATGNGPISFAALWPRLRAITTWTGGSCGLLVPRLKELLANEACIAELGYMASEFRGTIAVDGKSNVAVPTLHDNFFEFVEKDEWEAQSPCFRRLHEVEVGKEYYVIVTTREGLYRYFIDDIVRVTGAFHNTPAIEFVQKGKGTTNITGEKLFESQVLAAIETAVAECGLAINFFMMIADPDAMRYQLYVEHEATSDTALVASMERELMRANIEYGDKRRSARLKPLEVIFVRPGTGDAYRQHCVSKGQREAQFKIQYLQYKGQAGFDFDACAH